VLFSVPLAPAVPIVSAEFNEVTIPLKAESVDCIKEVTALVLVVYWSTDADAASEVTILAEAVGSSEG
jgi:hypothetical protein